MSKSSSDFILVQGRPEVHQGLIVDWYLSKLCNYSCSYCGLNIHDQWGPQLDEAKAYKFIDKIIDICGDRTLNINLVGGEPTVQKSLLPLLKYLLEKESKRDSLIKTSLVSNFSKPVNYFVELLPYVNHFLASIHFEFVHNKLEKLAEKLSLFQVEIDKINKSLPAKEHKTMYVRLMIIPESIPLAETLENLLKGTNVTLEYRKTRTSKREFISDFKSFDKDDGWRWVWKKDIDKTSTRLSTDYHLNGEDIKLDNSSDQSLGRRVDYTDDEMNWLKLREKGVKKNLRVVDEIGREDFLSFDGINMHDLNRLKGWLCHVGKNYFKVDGHGQVFRSNCHQGGSLGYLLDLPTSELQSLEPMICQRQKCTDLLDLTQPKVKDRKYLNQIK